MEQVNGRIFHIVARESAHAKRNHACVRHRKLGIALGSSTANWKFSRDKAVNLKNLKLRKENKNYSIGQIGQTSFTALNL